MTMKVKCNRFLYADDKCLVFQRENVNDIENQLNEKILLTYAIRLLNKLSIHFGEDKIKLILLKGRSKKFQ